MSDIPINNIINVTVATPPAGLADFHVNNLAILTKEAPINVALTATNPGVYLSPSDVAADWGTGSEVYAMANKIFGQPLNIKDGGGVLVIFPMAGGDTLTSFIPGAQKVAPFYGVLYAGYAPNDAEIIAAATAVEPLRIKLFASSKDTSSLTPSTGLFAILAAGNFPHTRRLLYTGSGNPGDVAARAYAAAYAGRSMCVDFSGTGTTNTMQLKQLTGITADTGITQAIFDTCATLGVDIYPTIAGRPSVVSNGANGGFFDDVYNLDWLVFRLEVAGFNALAGTATKLPQTETGMAALRSAYIAVCKQAVTNGYVAPGFWTSPETFGTPADFLRNIAQLGWYVWSPPVALQSAADRQARKAPVIRIAIKLAGAIHTSDVVVNVNP